MRKEVFRKRNEGQKIFSKSVDSTSDLNHTDQLTVIVRYILDSCPMERFLEFLSLTSHRGQDMGDLLLERLNESNIDVINCREQSHDNASNISGTYKGM